MRWILGILAVFAVGCKGGPDKPFDAGHPVHVIVGAPDRPKEGLRVEPVVTLGTKVRHVGPLRLGSAAVEVARFEPARGTHTFSFFDKKGGATVRQDLEVRRELWVLVELPQGKQPAITVYDEPPGREIGAWKPLVSVPD